MRVDSRCGHWVRSLGGGGIERCDQWPVCIDIPTLFSYLFSTTSRSMIIPTSHLIFPKMFLLVISVLFVNKVNIIIIIITALHTNNGECCGMIRRCRVVV